jgi:hypothetical protein
MSPKRQAVSKVHGIATAAGIATSDPDGICGTQNDTGLDLPVCGLVHSRRSVNTPSSSVGTSRPHLKAQYKSNPPLYSPQQRVVQCLSRFLLLSLFCFKRSNA